MDVSRAAAERRTIRRFQEKAVPFKALEKCVEAARLAPSARNIQELEFVVVDSSDQVAKINATVTFGGAVREKGRVRGEEPKAFIIIVSDDARSSGDYTPINAGIAAEAIALQAWEQGIGGCIMGAIDREKIKAALGIPAEYSVQLAVALGYPKEKPKAEKASGGKLDYWVHDKGELHVPKRSIAQVLHRNRFVARARANTRAKDKEIATRLGISQRHVRRLSKEMGVKKTYYAKTGPKGSWGKRLTPKEKTKIKRLRMEEDLSEETLAAMFDVTQPAIHYVLNH